MLRAHTVERGTPRPRPAAMADLPDGALMQRAAAGLAAAVLDLLGGGYGRRVLLLVGPGDNGGDALWAGARLAGPRCPRRGAPARRPRPRPGPGRARGRRAAGRPATSTTWTPVPTCVVDGIVGIGGRPGLRPDAASVLERFAGVPVVAVDVPSGVDVDTGRRRRPARAGRPHRHLRHPQGRPPRRPRLARVRRRAPGRPRARPAAPRPSRRSSPTTCARCCRGPAWTRRSTPAAWSAYAPARTPTPAPRCSRSRAPTPGWSGWSATSGRSGRRPRPRHAPRGRRRRPGAGLGGRARRR